MNTDIPKSKGTQLAIIWSITTVATCSVLSGVGYGIRRISEICFCIGLSLMFSVLFLGLTNGFHHVFYDKKIIKTRLYSC